MTDGRHVRFVLAMSAIATWALYQWRDVLRLRRYSAEGHRISEAFAALDGKRQMLDRLLERFASFGPETQALIRAQLEAWIAEADRVCKWSSDWQRRSP